MKNIAQLLQLEANCRSCESVKDLGYIIVNETRELVDYDQAVLVSPNMSGKLRVDVISDISVVDATSPFVQWLEGVSKSLVHLENASSLHVVDIKKELNQLQRTQLGDYSPPNILWIPLITMKGDIETIAYLLLFKNKLWNDDEKALLSHIASSYSYFIFSLRKCGFKTWLQKKSFSSSYVKVAILVIFLLMFLPVKLTVLSPLEVQAKNPIVVTSPLNGAVDDIKVMADQVIKKGDLIAKIEDADYENNYEIAKRTLKVVKAQLHTIKQNSFIDYREKSKVASIEAEVELKQVEMDYAEYEFKQTNIYAQESGIVIINDPNDWNGKPVVVGEKIMLIADKKNIEMKIMLPVSDAIFLNEDALVKVFFDNDPLSSWTGKISQIYYEPELTPQSILSYKIIAGFDDINENGYIPKIGLRGTAKIYAEDVTLFFYLFKKPITSVRQWIGW